MISEFEMKELNKRYQFSPEGLERVAEALIKRLEIEEPIEIPIDPSKKAEILFNV